MNPLDVISMLRGGANPQQVLLNMLQNMAPNNQAAASLLTLARNGKEKEIEEFARNYFKSMGRDFDKEFKDFRKQSGL